MIILWYFITVCVRERGVGHKTKVMWSFSLERSYHGSFLEDAEEDSYPDTSPDQSGDFNPSCLSIQKSSSLMTEVLSELIDRMKTMEHQDPATGSLVSDLLVPTHRDSLTTFTVVPRRRPQSTRQYECLLTMETIPRDTEGNLEESSSEFRQDEKMEISSSELVVLKEREEFDNVEEINNEMGVTEKLGEVDLNMDEERLVQEDRDRMEEQEKRDWVEEYRERRRRFLFDDRKETKFKTFTKVFNEEIMEDDPLPPPQLPVCWEEKDNEKENLENVENFGKEEARKDEPTNSFTIPTPNPSRYDPQHEPTEDPTPTKEPYWDVKLSTDLHSSNSDTPFTTYSPHHQPTSVRASDSNLHPSFEISSPNSASLFAMAVAQRAQRLGHVVCARTSSSTKALQSLSSYQTTSQKLYFQNLISEENLKIPTSQGVCSEDLPISKAPPMVVMTTQARRRAWSSFSHQQ